MDEAAKEAFARARAAERAGNTDEARKAFDDLVTHAPDEIGAWSARGLFLERVKDFEGALAAFRRSTSIAPNHPDHYNAGNALLALGRDEEALGEYDASLRCNDAYAEAWVNRGIVLTNLGRAAEARASFDHAIAVNPKLANAFRCRSILLERLGEHDGAESDARRVAEILATDADAWIRCATLVAEHGDRRSLDVLPGGREERILEAVERALETKLDPKRRRWALAERLIRLMHIAHGRQSMARAASVAGIAPPPDLETILARYRAAAEEAAGENPDDPWFADTLADARDLA